MTLISIGLVSHAVFIAALILNCVLGTSPLWLIGWHLRYRREALAREGRWSAAPMADDDALPAVLMQIPTFNEGNLVLRIAQRVGELDWPKARLHIQILDDSNDGSVRYGEAAAAALRRQGFDAMLLHRADRNGFKAGALAAGLRQSAGEEFVAMLDADYLPPRDFLRACMPPLLADASLAFVQARCDYFNGGENRVTRAQQRILDAHFAVEQSARCWAGQIMPFNGTCGIWRRRAIDEAGGWQGDTLAEDLDLSYRVQLCGWRALFLFNTTVPGELPADFAAWRIQQFRWSKGFAEVARKLLPALWRSPVPLRQKLFSTLHFSSSLFGSLLGVTLISGAIDLTIGTGITPLVIALIILAELESIGGIAAMLLLGQRVARGTSLLEEIAALPATLGLIQYLVLANLRATIEAIGGRGTAFMRTPKRATGNH